MPQNASVLAEALGRTGAGALPYAAEFKFLVEQHLNDLVSDLPSLTIKTQDYSHIDGRTARLLLASGTVPMYYQGVKYNIPVAVWLPEQYPLAAPMAYVVPTPDMVIKPRHRFVDASGLVHTPYITQWQYPASNLREMAQDMSMHFGSDPPLFSKPKNWHKEQQQQQQQVHQQSAQPPPLPAANLSAGAAGRASAAAAGADTFHAQNPLTQGQGASYTARPAGVPRPSPGAKPVVSSSAAITTGYNDASSIGGAKGGFESVWAAVVAASGGAHPQQQQAQPPEHHAPPPPPQQAQPPKDNTAVKVAAAFRIAAVTALNKCLHTSVTAASRQVAAESQEQVDLQARLRQRGEQLQAEVSALQAERVALDKLSHDLAASSSQLDRWLASNEHLGRAADDPSLLNPDVIISAADPLSQQALEVQAQDLALEDALYALDKSLNASSIEPDAYLKQVRAVCRRQFFVRTVGNKVAAQQEKQQQLQGAAAAPWQGQGQQQAHAHMQGRPQPPELQRSASSGRAVMLPQGDSWASAGIIANRRENDWYSGVL